MTVSKSPNPGKSLELCVEGKGCFLRFPVKTKLIEPGDDFVKIILKETEGELQDGDILLVAESALAASQGRIFDFEKIKYGFWAKLLSSFVSKSPHGIGLATPQTMQLAIDEVGLPRILLAAFVHALTRPFGFRGNFYRIAGEKARGIDGPTEGTIPPYDKFASLVPKDPEKFAAHLEKESGKDIKVIVIDANDIGVNVLGEKDKEWQYLAKELAKDNPLGQSDESTPLLLCRKVGK